MGWEEDLVWNPDRHVEDVVITNLTLDIFIKWIGVLPSVKFSELSQWAFVDLPHFLNPFPSSPEIFNVKIHSHLVLIFHLSLFQR